METTSRPRATHVTTSGATQNAMRIRLTGPSRKLVHPFVGQLSWLAQSDDHSKSCAAGNEPETKLTENILAGAKAPTRNEACDVKLFQKL